MKTIIEDTRNQIGKHENIHKQLQAMGYEIKRHGMMVGDYTMPLDQSVCIDTKKDLQELCGNVCQAHKRFRNELALAKEMGVKLIVLCEHGDGITKLSDVNTWYNPRLRTSRNAMSGHRLFKVLYAIQAKYGCEFLFCDKNETGKRIIELLENKEVTV